MTIRSLRRLPPIALLAVLVLGLAGFQPHLDGGLSSAETASLLRRLTLSFNPLALEKIHLTALETWTETGQSAADDREVDQVFFYHAVPIELEVSHNDRPLDLAALRQQKKLAERVEKQIDRQPSGVNRLLNLNGEIWPFERFVAQFQWTAQTGPEVDGHPSLELDFVPAPHLHPGSRMQRILGMTAGELLVDGGTGQILGGSFHSLGSVKFGGGLLAHIGDFEGHFTMQPAGDVWVMKQVVVTVQGRELFSHIHGTETMVYSLDPLSQP